MEEKDIILSGRKYRAMVSPDEQSGAYVIIGPPEGLVDEMGIPEPYATTLHNILYERKIFTYKDVSYRNNAVGVLQEWLTVDSQLLSEMFLKFEKEEIVA